MISINGEEIQLEAESINQLMMEISSLLSAVSSKVEEMTGTPAQDVELDIVNALKFSRLVDNGMSKDEAFSVLNPE